MTTNEENAALFKANHDERWRSNKDAQELIDTIHDNGPLIYQPMTGDELLHNYIVLVGAANMIARRIGPNGTTADADEMARIATCALAEQRVNGSPVD